MAHADLRILKKESVLGFYLKSCSGGLAVVINAGRKNT
jgi:hypothetical protein